MPTIIERDTSLPDTLSALVKHGYIKLDDALDDPVQTGFEAILDRFPYLKKADEDWGDALGVSGEADDLRAQLYNHALSRVIYIKPVIDQLLTLNDPAVMNWLGYRLGHHGGLLDPRCRWLDFVQELQGEETTDDNGDPLPRADDAAVEQFKLDLQRDYSYLINPAEPSITDEQAREKIATIDPELAGILYALSKNMTGFQEAYASIGLDPEDLISHGIERFNHYQYNGYSECMEDTFCERAGDLTELVAMLGRWEARLTPIENLNQWTTCKLTSRNTKTSDSPEPS